VVVDLQGMDHNSAIQLVQRLKQSSARNIPALALSIPPDSALQTELQEAGYSHIVHKPLRCTTLISGLLQVLGMQVNNPSRKANTNAEMLAGRRLLVVDDNMVNRRVASSMLQRYGATVVTVNGGNQAINAVKKQDPDKPFDMILMDIQMPEVQTMFKYFAFIFGTSKAYPHCLHTNIYINLSIIPGTELCLC
jgi:histidine kinase 2/3/4 (cytokinin receptor)